MYRVSALLLALVLAAPASARQRAPNAAAAAQPAAHAYADANAAAMPAASAPASRFSENFYVCLDGAGDANAEVVTCVKDESALFDARRNSAFGAALKRMSPPERVRLRDSERRWTEVRDTDCALVRDWYEGREGAGLGEAYCRLHMAEARVAFLQRFLYPVGR